MKFKIVLKDKTEKIIEASSLKQAEMTCKKEKINWVDIYILQGE